ncbi:MAG: hypothetical protein Q4D79_11165 [Propionibacteriaceae bacterium]|nr:hypothetical protein [Propionibacteriaceae bacterium]
MRLITDQSSEEVTQFLHVLGMDSPLDIEVEMVEIGEYPSWSSHLDWTVLVPQCP